MRRRGAAWGGDAGGVGLGDGGGAGQELAVVGGAGVVGVGVGGASSAHEGSRDRDTGSHHTRCDRWVLLGMGDGDTCLGLYVY